MIINSNVSGKYSSYVGHKSNQVILPKKVKQKEELYTRNVSQKPVVYSGKRKFYKGTSKITFKQKMSALFLVTLVGGAELGTRVHLSTKSTSKKHATTLVVPTYNEAQKNTSYTILSY
jgi:hypothetical protein